MKTSEVKKKAKEIIDNYFYKVIQSDVIQEWRTAMIFINNTIKELEE
jgi:hypothetical protein